jgi:hypothetical protein
MVHLARGFRHALNDVLHAAERERLGVSVFKLRERPLVSSQDLAGVSVEFYAIPFQRIINNCAGSSRYCRFSDTRPIGALDENGLG